jgi:hypothetical protein
MSVRGVRLVKAIWKHMKKPQRTVLSIVQMRLFTTWENCVALHVMRCLAPAVPRRAVVRQKRVMGRTHVG